MQPVPPDIFLILRLCLTHAEFCLTRAVYEQLYCEDEYNSATKRAEEVCHVPPYAATAADMESEGCELLGDYGSRTRWACAEKLGANAEEEYVSAKLAWVHYVR